MRNKNEETKTSKFIVLFAIIIAGGVFYACTQNSISHQNDLSQENNSMSKEQRHNLVAKYKKLSRKKPRQIAIFV